MGMLMKHRCVEECLTESDENVKSPVDGETGICIELALSCIQQHT